MSPFALFDALLISPFRIIANPEAAFLLGVLVLAVGSAMLGRAGSALVRRAQRLRWASQEAEAKRRHELSIQAAKAGDRTAYLAQNHLAQEAYGNTLALSAGRAAALLWPGCAVLAWMVWRFEGAPMPFLWESAGPAAYFLPLHLAALWGLGRLARRGNKPV